MFDLTIIGGGPAGVAAGVYAARKQLKTLFIAREFGGQSIVSEGIENWIGTTKIPGPDLAKNLEAHLRAQNPEFLTIKDFTYVTKISQSEGGFAIETDAGNFTSRSILIATGSTRRKLPAKNADIFENKGITYCASCDGPLFARRDVAVIGAGNAAFETAAQLLAYCTSVTMFNRAEDYKADEQTVKKVLAHPQLKVLNNVEVTEVNGAPSTSSGQVKFVNGLTYKNSKTGEEITMPIGGIFVEIGAVPATGFAKDLVKTNQFGAIVVDPRNQMTSVAGIWAAGDCTDGLYHQNNIAAGDAVKALEDIYLWLKTK